MPAQVTLEPTIERWRDEIAISDAAVTGPPYPPRTSTVEHGSTRIERILVFAIPCLVYLIVGWILVFRYASFNGDAQARVANAYYVLFSRDPHVASIGFVWNPLPSVSVMPLLPLKVLWPALTTRAFAGNIMSALFMAGAGYQIYEFFRDLGLGWALRLGLIAAFVLNPMIIYYGGNGMSEGLFIFTLVLAARYLARWLVEDRTIWLTVSAAALGLAYLARNEAAFAAFFATLVVVYVSFRRSTDTASRRNRIYKSLTDGFIYGLPFAVCFIGWAIVSWVIVGHPFEQFQSVYGTSSQLRVINAASKTVITRGEAARRALHAATAMAPTLSLVAFAALVGSARRKDWRALSALAIPGGVLLFAVVAYTLGKTAGWFRYYITAIPLLVMLGGTLAALVLFRPRRSTGARPSRTDHRPPATPLSRVGGLIARAGISTVVVALVAVSVPTTAQALLNSPVASEEQLHLDYILRPQPHNASEADERHRYGSTVSIAKALDAMHLPHGAILVDNFTPCVPYILLDSKHPQQFVIPNDRDFQQLLADPGGFHVQYLLVPPPGGYGDLDALNRQYPNLYNAGADIGTKVNEWQLPGCPHFRLYKVTGSSP